MVKLYTSQKTMKLSVLKGSNIYLKTMKEDILPKLQNWLLDSEINKFLDDSECNLIYKKLSKNLVSDYFFR